MLYIVWVGGIPDYEGNSKSEANAILNEWLADGYDDACLEEWSAEEWNG